MGGGPGRPFTPEELASMQKPKPLAKKASFGALSGETQLSKITRKSERLSERLSAKPKIDPWGSRTQPATLAMQSQVDAENAKAAQAQELSNLNASNALVNLQKQQQGTDLNAIANVSAPSISVSGNSGTSPAISTSTPNKGTDNPTISGMQSFGVIPRKSNTINPQQQNQNGFINNVNSSQNLQFGGY